MTDLEVRRQLRRNAALWLTISRLVLAPLFAVVFLRVPGVTGAAGALALCVLIELTDALDGMLARKMNLVTDLGKILDPLADSVSRLTIFFCFANAGIAPIELVLLLLYRDMTVAMLRTICASHGLVLAARWSGKLKAVLQAIVILVILVLNLLYHAQPPAWLPVAYLGLVVFVTIYTAYSGIEYLISTWPVVWHVIHKDAPTAQ